jgi:hypothetical protein
MHISAYKATSYPVYNTRNAGGCGPDDVCDEFNNHRPDEGPDAVVDEFDNSRSYDSGYNSFDSWSGSDGGGGYYNGI